MYVCVLETFVTSLLLPSLTGVRTTATSMVSSMAMMATESPTLWVRGSLRSCCSASYMQITAMLMCAEFCCR